MGRGETGSGDGSVIVSIVSLESPGATVISELGSSSLIFFFLPFFRGMYSSHGVPRFTHRLHGLSFLKNYNKTSDISQTFCTRHM